MMMNFIKLIIISMLLINVVMAQTATIPANGNGSSGNPFQIETLDNLYWFSVSDTVWDKHYIQTVNIDASSTNTWNSGAGFSPIGGEDIRFKGSYNGQGHTINNLYIYHPEHTSTQVPRGFFGWIEGASITNLGLTNVDITGRTQTGALIGKSYYSNIHNCNSSGTVSLTEGYGGGLVGRLVNSLLNNSYSTCSVTSINSYTYYGGLVGETYIANITYCHSSGIVSGNISGGLVGIHYNTSTIDNCYSTSTVSGSTRIGGLVGYNNGCEINNCYSSGSVSSTGGRAGGLVGENRSLSATINNCYSTTSVTGNYEIGGLVGYNISGDVNNSYSTGSVSGTTDVGGLIGYDENSNTTNSFWDIETSGIDTSDGGSGKTSNEMHDLCMYLDAGWDFDIETTNGNNNYWIMNSNENNNYPSFYWRGIQHTAYCCNYACAFTDTIIECDSITWIDGNTYTESNNTTTHTLQTICGADSIIILNLTINFINELVTVDSTTLTADLSGVSYQWIDCNDNNSPILGEPNQSFTPTADGNYAVVVYDGICLDTSICYTVIVTELNNIKEDVITIYPNPTTGKVQIKNAQNSTIEIISIAGKSIKTINATEKNTVIDLSTAPKGIYFVKVSSEKGVDTQKLILE